MLSDKKVDPVSPITDAPPEIRNIIKRVLVLEKEKLFQQKPRLNAEILQIIKDEIK